MSSIDTKELKESLGLGVIFVTVKARVDYFGSVRKPTIMPFGKNGVIAADADVLYDYGKKKQWFP